MIMKEKELLSTISNFYAKFYNSSEKTLPICSCTNVFELKVLKIGKNIINYGICGKCSRISFFKEYKYYSDDSYKQYWTKLSFEKVKEELEQLINITINENDLQYYTPKFDEILDKIDEINKKRIICESTLLNNQG